MYWRILRKSLRRQKRRLATTWVSMVIVAALATLLWSLWADVGAKITREVSKVGPNLVITPAMKSGSRVLLAPELREIQDALPSDLVQAATELAVGVVKVGKERIAAVGFDSEAARSLYGHWQVDGRWPRHPGEILVGAEAAGLLSVKLGDRITLSPENGSSALVVEVVGVVQTGGDEEWQLFGDAATLRPVLNVQGVTALQLRLDAPGSRIAEIARNLKLSFPGIEAAAVLRIAKTEAALYRTLTVVLGGVTLLALILTLLALGSGLTTAFLERQREIAVLKALGASRTRMGALLFGEVLVASVLAALIGIGLGILAAQWTEVQVFGTGMDLRWPVLPGVLVTVVATALTGAVWPFRRVLAVAPGVVLKGE